MALVCAGQELIASTASRGWIAYQEADAGATQPQRIGIVETSDAGRTWGNPHTVATGRTLFYPMVANNGSAVAVGYYRWADADSAHATSVMASVSTDGGATWCEQVVDGPLPVPPGARDYQSAATMGTAAGFS